MYYFSEITSKQMSNKKKKDALILIANFFIGPFQVNQYCFRNKDQIDWFY